MTPTHQYPLGGALPVARRTVLLQWAVGCDGYIVEDDYDSEFTSKAQPLPPLQCLDRDERVVYVGSFSKTLAPGIRVGYVVVPPHLVDAFTVARAVAGLAIGIHLQGRSRTSWRTGTSLGISAAPTRYTIAAARFLWMPCNRRCAPDSGSALRSPGFTSRCRPGRVSTTPH